MAWVDRFSANGDFGIVALMAKHMAEGTDYPVFSYGVAYMGGLEPVLSALAKWLLKGDATAFPINLGTAVLGAFLLPLVYVLGRDAGGRRAGLIALLYCLVGSDALLHYSVAPRGGYMSLLVGGTLALWLTCRAVTLENRGGRAPGWMFWVIGAATGAAWWATQLAAVFILSAVVIVVAGWRWRLVLRGTVPALLGFVSGALPWWVWNASHGWISLEFGSSLGKVRLGEGLTSFGSLFTTVVEMPPDTWHGLLRLVLIVLVAAGFLAILVSDQFRRRNRQDFYYRLAVPVLIIITVLFYSTSQFVRANACRYLLPVVPVLAVMIGVVCDRLLNRFRLPWGWVLAVLLLPSQILLLSHMGDGVASARARWGLARQLEEKVAPLCGGVFLGDYYAHHWLNYASGEAFCVAALPMERYASYARRAELARQPAYIDNYNDLRTFLEATRGGFHSGEVQGIPVDYGLTPPANDWRYLDRESIVEARDHAGEEGLDELLDAAIRTTWDAVLAPGSRTNLVFNFTRPVTLAGLRFISPCDQYPRALQVEVRNHPDAPWVVVLPETGATRYFWSGSFAKLDGLQYYQEFRLPPSTGGVVAVRLTLVNPGASESPASLSEILFLEANPMPVAAFQDVESVARVLCQNGIRQVYAPRWLASGLAAMNPVAFTTAAPALLSRKLDELPRVDSACPVPLVFRGLTALLMDLRDAPRSRVALGAAGCRYREVPLGSLVMLVVREDQVPRPGEADKLYWTELGCFVSEGFKWSAHRLYRAAVARVGYADREEILRDLREAVRLYPSHYAARAALVAHLREAGLTGEAATNATRLKADVDPELPFSIRFANGIQFLGLTFGGEVRRGATNIVEVARGQSLPMTYYWKCPPAYEVVRWAAFVHLVKGRARLQNDHVLLLRNATDGLVMPPYDGIAPDPQVMTIPAAAAPGDYRIDMGVVDRWNGVRAALQTELPTYHKAATLPVIVRVR